MKTKAAVIYENNAPFEIEEVDLQEPSTGEILVELKATGICRTDEHAVTGSMPNPLPAVLGHEGAGIVKEIGPGVTTVKEGDHVVLVWMPACGICEYCRSGKAYICVRGAGLLSGFMLDGKTRFKKNGKDIHHYLLCSSFSEYVVVPEESAVVIDKEAPFKQTCLLGCALTTGFGGATRTAKVEAGSNAVIYGFGGVGSGALNGLVQSGADMIVVVDPNDWKEEVARKMGASHFINPKKEDPVEKIMELTNGVGVHYGFDCWGDVDVEAQAVNSIRNDGKAVFIGGPHAEMNTIPIHNLTFCMTEKMIMASLYGSCIPQVDVPKFVSMYMHGKFDLDTVITKTYTLEEINKGFEDLRNGDVIRGVIMFD